VKDKHKKRGKSSSMKRMLRKNTNIIDARREALKARLEKEAAQAKAKREPADGVCV
jgi:hypothetical protein